MTMMKIKAAYLGGSRGETGCAAETIEVAEQCSVADAIKLICEKHPGLKAHLGTARWALNFEFVDEDNACHF